LPSRAAGELITIITIPLRASLHFFTPFASSRLSSLFPPAPFRPVPSRDLSFFFLYRASATVPAACARRPVSGVESQSVGVSYLIIRTTTTVHPHNRTTRSLALRTTNDTRQQNSTTPSDLQTSPLVHPLPPSCACETTTRGTPSLASSNASLFNPSLRSWSHAISTHAIPSTTLRRRRRRPKTRAVHPARARPRLP
jgi:hypothetical protein